MKRMMALLFILAIVVGCTPKVIPPEIPCDINNTGIRKAENSGIMVCDGLDWITKSQYDGLITAYNQGYSQGGLDIINRVAQAEVPIIDNNTLQWYPLQQVCSINYPATPQGQ